MWIGYHQRTSKGCDYASRCNCSLRYLSHTPSFRRRWRREGRQLRQCWVALCHHDMPPAAEGKIVPSSWNFRGDGTAFTFEFAFSPTPSIDALSSLDITLMKDVHNILAENQLTDILGLSLLSRNVIGMETTGGRANVTWRRTL